MILAAAFLELRTGLIEVEIEHNDIGVTIHEMEIRLTTRVDDVAFGSSLMRELVEIVIERRPTQAARITCLVVAGRRHTRHLPQELLSGFEIIVVPVAVVTLAGHKISVHQGDVAIEIADKVLHVGPVVACIAVDIADREDTVGSACFGSCLGETNLIAAAIGICAYGEIVAGVGLQSRERYDMHIAFAFGIPTGAGLDMLVEVVSVSSDICQSTLTVVVVGAIE